MAYFGAHAEHDIAVHDDDRYRLFVLCTDRYPLYRQHAHGPELTGRYLHAGRIPRSWAVWHTPVVLRPCFLLQSGTRRKRRLLHSPPVRNRQQVCPQGKDFAGRKRLLYRTPRTYRVWIRTEYAFPAYVQFLARPALQAMGWHQGTWRTLRPMWRNGHGEYAYPMGEHQVLLLLPVELHVLALLHVELRRTPERHSG